MPATSKIMPSTRAQHPPVTVLPSREEEPKKRPSFSHMPRPSAPNNQSSQNNRLPKLQPVQNRVSILLVHIPRLSIRGQARLATEVGVSRSTISRLVSGRINPSYRLARGVTDALERFLGRPLDMREVFSTDGTYLTPSGCALCRCTGCLPDRAYDPEGNLRPEWQGQHPGDWSLTPLIASSLQTSLDACNGDLVGATGAGEEGQVREEGKVRKGDQ